MPEEMACILEMVKSYGLRPIRYGANCKYPTKNHAIHSAEYTSLSGCFLISESLTRLEITTSYYTNDRNKKPLPTTWLCSLNESKITSISGQRAYMEFQKAAKIPTLKQMGIENILHKSSVTGSYLQSATPLIGSKTMFLSEYSNVYEYDRNSAYSSVLLEGVPLFSQIDYNRVVREREIGFMLDENLCLCHEGEIAEVIFPLVPCPIEIQNYIQKWYNLKKEGDPNAKCMLNFPIGYYQRTNPFFRAYVVNRCNEIIRNLIGEHIITWNTDAVYSLIPLDLKVGEEIGEWKLRKIKKFKLQGCNYQIEEENPVYRGIPKYWFEAFKRVNGRPFDLSKDVLPERVNKWHMDWEHLSLLGE